MSETISPPRNERGIAAVTPLPNEIEDPEPGGVNWTTRKSFPITMSSSSRLWQGDACVPLSRDSDWFLAGRP